MKRDLPLVIAAAALVVAILIGGFLAVKVQVVHAEGPVFSVVTDEAFCLAFVGEEFAAGCVESLAHTATIPASLFPDHETYMALWAERNSTEDEDHDDHD